MKHYLYIEEGDKDISLPKEYHKINNICALIYDQLTEIYNSTDFESLKVTNVSLPNDIDLVDQLNNGAISTLEWLENNDKQALEVILTKQLILAITNDLTSFMFESLSCALRGHMTVAFALLRKPLIDELLLLEQLLVDREDFIKRYYYTDSSDKYDPSKTVNKKEIIEKAIQKLKCKHHFTAERIFDLRYNKSEISGYNWIMNHALHIVTSDKNYKTEKQNLNFVFSQKEDVERYYLHYYGFIPTLLIYSVSIIDELVFDILSPNDSSQRVIREFKRLLALLFLVDNQKDKIDKLFDDISKELIVECPKCKNMLSLEKADCELYFYSNLLLCPKCFNRLLLSEDLLDKIKNVIYPK